jgi:type IV pilus assembly protein PilY1
VVAAYGTITINASATANRDEHRQRHGRRAGRQRWSSPTAPSARQRHQQRHQAGHLATSLAASIIAKTGLTNQYLACVKAPTHESSVPACSTYGISLGANNIVAVMPIDCVPGTTSKAVGMCSVLPDASRSGWSLSVNARRCRCRSPTRPPR